MLRENLDTVLKDLLEFKENEKIISMYPGPRLDVHESFLNTIKSTGCKNVLANSKKSGNNTLRDFLNKGNKTNIINRIKRYLDITSKRRLIKRYENIRTKSKMDSLKSHDYRQSKNYKYITEPKTSQTVRYGRKLSSYNKMKRNKKSIESIILKIKKATRSDIDPARGDATLKARFLFKSCMNHDILAKRGYQPLLDLLDVYGGWPILNPAWQQTDFDWLELMAKLRLFNNDILISQWVGPDIRNSDEFVIQFDQTSLGKYCRLY